MSDAPDFIASTGQERDTTLPRFYMRLVQVPYKSEQAGRPIHEEFEFVEINVPGDRKTVVDRLVKPEDKARWPRHYAAFKAGQEIPVEGTALEDTAWISRAQVEELRYSHVRTVEALAELSDDQLNKTVSMGGFALREKAKRHLEQSAGNAPMDKLAAENAAQASTIKEMEQRMKAMEAAMASLAKPPEPTAQT